MIAKSEHNQLTIKKDVSVATLRDMTNKKEMLNQQMEETIEEKLILETENNKMDDYLNHKSEEAKKACLRE